MKDLKWYDKGLYHHPQPAGFVSLKQYMIIDKDGKKCLMLRFFNELKVPVGAIEFKLVQLNTQGSVLASDTIKLDSMKMAPGATHAMKTGIVLKDKCTDFRVTVISARSNGYKYVMKHGIPTPTYDIRRESSKLAPKESSRSLTTKISSKGKKAAAFLSIGIIIASMILMIYLSIRNFGHFTASDFENLLF